MWLCSDCKEAISLHCKAPFRSAAWREVRTLSCNIGDKPAYVRIGNISDMIRYSFFLWRCGPMRAMASSFLMRFLDSTKRRTIICRTSLDEWSACRRDLYLTTNNTHNRQTSGGIRAHNPSKWAAAGPGLRARAHWDRQDTRLFKVVWSIPAYISVAVWQYAGWWEYWQDILLWESVSVRVCTHADKEQWHYVERTMADISGYFPCSDVFQAIFTQDVIKGKGAEKIA